MAYQLTLILEMLNIVIAVKLWASMWAGETVQVYGDNAATIAVLNSGRSRDSFLLQCAREIWFLTANHKITLCVEHTRGADNLVADALSRRNLAPEFTKHLTHFDPKYNVTVDPCLFNLTVDI